MEQSCAFTHVCFSAASTPEHDPPTFYYIPSDHEKQLQQILMQQPKSQQPLISISTIAWDPITTTKQVSLGAILGDDTTAGNDQQQQPWFPTIIDTAIVEQREQHRLPPSTIVLPIRFTTPMTEASLWKDLFAIYTLLSLFGYTATNPQNTDTADDILLVSMEEEEEQTAATMLRPEWLQEVLRATLWEPTTMTTTTTTILQCTSRAVAGLGRVALDTSGTHVLFRGIGLADFGDYARQQLLRTEQAAGVIMRPESSSSSRILWVVPPGDTVIDVLSSFPSAPPPQQVTIESLGAIVALTPGAVLAKKDDDDDNATTTASRDIWIVPSHHPFIFPLATLLPRGSILLVQQTESSLSGEHRQVLSRHDRLFLQSFTHVQVRFLGREEAVSNTVQQIQKDLAAFVLPSEADL